MNYHRTGTGFHPLAELVAIVAIAISCGLLLGKMSDKVFAQSPSVTQSYGLTLERDDFPPSAPVAGSPTVFQTSVSTRSSFAVVYRNGSLQRPCGIPTGPCDYNVSGNVIVTFPASGPSSIQAGDQVTVFFYR